VLYLEHRVKVSFEVDAWLGMVEPPWKRLMTPTPNRSPTQVVIRAFQMVIWVILWLSATGFLFRDDNEIFINLP
jgi:hypothetical protein